MEELESNRVELFRTFHLFKKLNLASLLPDISMVEMHTLIAIEHAMVKQKEKKAPVSMLCKETKAPPAGISRTLRGLEQRGYLERKTDKADRRHTYVTLTPKGEAITAESHKIMHEFIDAVFAQMGEEDVEKLRQCLVQLYETAQSELANRQCKKKENDKDEENI